MCVSKPDTSSSIECHRAPLISHTVALGDMFLYYHEHTDRNIVLLPQIVTTASNVDSFEMTKIK